MGDAAGLAGTQVHICQTIRRHVSADSMLQAKDDNLVTAECMLYDALRMCGLHAGCKVLHKVKILWTRRFDVADTAPLMHVENHTQSHPVFPKHLPYEIYKSGAPKIC
jgi:hypothetical protein